MADIIELSKSINRVNQNVAAQGNTFRQISGENNRNVTKITKDIGSYFIQQRGSLDNVAESTKQNATAIESLGRKIDNNSNLTTQSISSIENVANLLTTTNRLLAQIAKNTLSSSGNTGGGSEPTLAQRALKMAGIAAAYGALGVSGTGVFQNIFNRMAGNESSETPAGGATPSTSPGGNTAQTGAAASPNIGNSRLSGSSVNPSEVFNYLKSKGATDIQAMGIMGNIARESTLNPGAFNPNDVNGPSGGLFQHHDNLKRNERRFTNMVNYVGADWRTNWRKQIDFAFTEQDMANYLRSNYNTPQEAAAAFYKKFERGANFSSDQAKAENWIAKFEKMGIGKGGVATPQSAPGGAAAPAATPAAPTPAAQPSVNAPGTLPNAPGRGELPTAKQLERTREGQRAPPAATPAPTAQSGQESKPEAQTPAGGTTQDAVAFLQSRQGGGSGFTGVNASKLNPTFAQKLMAAIQAAEQATGDKIVITEGYRDPAVQAQYYANYIQRPVTWEGKTYTPKKPGGLAAPPGRSNHQKGMAVDISRGRAREWLRANVDRFGLKQLGKKDEPHFELAGASLGGEYAPENTNQQAPGTGQGTAPGAGSVGAPSPGMGGMGGLPGIGAMGMRMPFGFGGMLGGMMGGGRMGAFGALAGMALGGLGAALGSTASAPSMPAGPTPTTTALQTPQTGKGFVSPFAGIDSENPAQFFAADKQLQSMIQNKQIQTAALESEANRQKPPTVNVTQPQQPADQQKTLLDQQGRSDMYTVVALWEKDIFKWLGIKEESNFG